MQFRKLAIKNLEVGQIYIAFSAKNKRLSSNGDKGVFVKLNEISGNGVKVQVLGTSQDTSIASLDTRDDAWMYSPSGVEIPVVVRIADKKQWPGFSPRMEREGWDGKAFSFKEDELYTVEDEESPGNGLTLLRHPGETIDPEEDMPYVNNFLMSNVFPTTPPEWRVPRAQRMGIGAVELPLPPKPVAEQHKAIIALLTPHLKTLVQGHTRDNVSYGKFSGDLKQKNIYMNQVCHRTLQSEEDFPVEYVITLGVNKGVPGSWFRALPVQHEAMVLWITYLTSYSPYAPVFISKSPEYIMEHGYIMDGNAPSRLLVGAAFATRQIWEKPARADAFYKLYEAGVPLDQAFVFGCQCSEFDGKKIKFAQSGDGHSHLRHSGLSDKCILNFIHHTPQYPGKPFIKDNNASSNTHGGKYGVDGTWSAAFAEKVSPMYKQLSSIKSVGGWGGAVELEDGVERAADMIDEWAGRHGV